MKLNLPNRLTLLRVLLVPVFMVLAGFAHYGQADFSPVLSALAGLVFAAASFTDYLDGAIARRRHIVSDFGKFADPLADKMLTTAALIYMMADGVCPPVVLALVLFREFAVAGVRMLAAAKSKVIAANLWGKVKTVLQMVTVIFYYLAAALAGPTDIFPVLAVTRLLCWVVAAATVISGVKYLWDNRACLSP